MYFSRDVGEWVILPCFRLGNAQLLVCKYELTNEMTPLRNCHDVYRYLLIINYDFYSGSDQTKKLGFSFFWDFLIVRINLGSNFIRYDSKAKEVVFVEVSSATVVMTPPPATVKVRVMHKTRGAYYIMSLYGIFQ